MSRISLEPDTPISFSLSMAVSIMFALFGAGVLYSSISSRMTAIDVKNDTRAEHFESTVKELSENQKDTNEILTQIRIEIKKGNNK